MSWKILICEQCFAYNTLSISTLFSFVVFEASHFYFSLSLPIFSHVKMSSPHASSNGDMNPKERSKVMAEEKNQNAPVPFSNAEFNTADETKLLWKIDLHLLPILFILYMFAFLDRVNIGNAKIQGLTKDLHMSGTQYNVASMILFVPYILLEVPSNIILKKVAPSMWLSGLMFFWGVTTMCQGFVKSYGGLLACRVFLGAFEAGVFPGKLLVHWKLEVLIISQVAHISLECTTNDLNYKRDWSSSFLLHW